MKSVPLVTYAVQSRGPVPSGLIVDNGMALMAGHLIGNGFHPRVFDYNSVESVEKIRKQGKPAYISDVIDELSQYVHDTSARAIGFKLHMNGFSDSVRIAHEIRNRHKSIMIFGGGPQVDWFMQEVFGYCQRTHGENVFDAVVFGDADCGLVELAKMAYGMHGEPRNVIYGRSGQTSPPAGRWYQDLDRLPFPVYDEDIYPRTGGKIFSPAIEDSRGCGFGCSFCVQPRIGGKRREKDVDRLLEEIEYMKSRYGTSVFRLSGPRPTAEYLSRLAESLPEDVRLSAFGYADESYDFDSVSEKTIAVFCGLESADPEILLRTYRKTRDVGDYLGNAAGMIKNFRDRGIATVTSLIVPSPNETNQSMERTFRFIEEAEPDFAPVLSVFPIPGTPLTRLAEKSPDETGVRLEENFPQKIINYELDLLRSPEEWPTAPWSVRVNGKFVDNPFGTTARFSRRLEDIGISPLSDEQVLMAYLYYGSLSTDQEERRTQCLHLNDRMRASIAEGDYLNLYKTVSQINTNNS